MSEIPQRIRELSDEAASVNNAYVVDLSLRGDRHNQVLEVFVDTDSGITAEGCAAISRDLASRIDHENLIPNRYNLTVSSPGLERPLKLLRQYQKNIGRSLKVRFQAPDEKKTIVGRLKQATEAGIRLEAKETHEDVDLAFDSIVESKVEIEWGRTPK